MAVFAGTGGNVKLGSAVVAEIGDWSLDIDGNTIDVSKFGTVWRTFIQSIRGWNGSFAGRLDQTDTLGQVVIQNALMTGATVTITFSIDGTHGYSGTAFISKIANKATATGTVDTSCTFVGTGVLTYA